MLDFSRYYDIAIKIIFLGLIGWLGFISKTAIDAPSREEMRYVLAESKQDGLKIQQQIELSNTEIRQLRIEIEKMLVVKPFDVLAKVERMEAALIKKMEQEETAAHACAQKWGY